MSPSNCTVHRFKESCQCKSGIGIVIYVDSVVSSKSKEISEYFTVSRVWHECYYIYQFW